MRDDSVRVCNRCVMDETAPSIEFDEDGNCNFCTRYFEEREKRKLVDKEKALEEVVREIKKAGKALKYDCLIGVSGGVDSTYVAYLVKQLGLRPLAVHLDNGWNSELAVENIHRTLSKLDIDLHTHVIDWEEFRGIQLSFLKASIPGMEIPSDHGIYSVLRNVAKKKGIKYILNGSNFKTEFIMERAWSEMVGQLDWLLIKKVHKKFGNGFFKTFPKTTRLSYYISRILKNPTVVYPLDYIEFSKDDAMAFIQEELGWVYYGGKHYESIYTRFTQAYIQPRKFNIDKRKAHFSNLICMGDLSREMALAELEKPAYPSEELMNSDLALFKKKLKLSDSEFEGLMKAETKTYRDYPGYHNSILHRTMFDALRKAFKSYKKLRSID